MTSAPMSASSLPPSGPAMIWVKSTTFTPWSGPGIWNLLHPRSQRGNGIALGVGLKSTFESGILVDRPIVYQLR